MSASAAPSPREPILTEAEAARRMLLLADLQAALAAEDIHSVLARNHRLVLRSGRTPCERSGPTDPQLHLFLPAGPTIATIDGAAYSVDSGQTSPVDDPRAAATLIRQLAGLQGSQGPSPTASSEVTT